ncbi:MAG: S41 family peptidase [Patescibacteria group bacterium]
MKSKNKDEVAVRKIHEKILEVYPFLTKAERDIFEKRTGIYLESLSNNKKTNGENTVSNILALLKNPHAGIKEWHKPDKEFMKRVKPERIPRFSIENRILMIKIPSWSMWLGPIDKKLVSFCVRNKSKYDSILIDVRENGGGNSQYAHDFAGIFFKKTVIYGKVTRRNKSSRLNTEISRLEPNKTIFIGKPIVILISNKCFSSNELFLAPFKVSKRATLIGQATAGGSANPTSEIVKISGKKFVVRVPTYRFFLKGKRQPIEKTKIDPDVVYKGRDIEGFAKNYLKKGEKK